MAETRTLGTFRRSDRKSAVNQERKAIRRAAFKNKVVNQQKTPMERFVVFDNDCRLIYLTDLFSQT